MEVMSDIRRIAVWAARCRHSRGFGVQSPWAYAFDRYVVNEHWPYYAYGELAAAHPGLPAAERRVLEFYFRLANHLQPDLVADFGRGDAAFADYVRAGCRRAAVLSPCGGEGEPGRAIDSLPRVDMARFVPSPAVAELWELAVGRVGERSAFVIEGIHSDARCRKLWRGVLADGRTGVTFDLYYCGIVFFDRKRYKQNYIINF